MSIGFSAGDFVTLINLTNKAYTGWKHACGNYADITGTLNELRVILARLKHEAEKPQSILRRTERHDLYDVLCNCDYTVKELSSIVIKYRSLGSSRQRNWDKLQFGVRNIDELRLRLTQHVALIGVQLDSIGLGALARIEGTLNAIPEQIKEYIDSLATDIREGRREESVLTTYEDDEKLVWRQFRRELVGEGINSALIHEHKPQIRAYLRHLRDTGALDEDAPDPLDTDPPLALEDSAHEEQSSATASHLFDDAITVYESETEPTGPDNGAPDIELKHDYIMSKAFVSQARTTGNLISSSASSPELSYTASECISDAVVEANDTHQDALVLVRSRSWSPIPSNARSRSWSPTPSNRRSQRTQLARRFLFATQGRPSISSRRKARRRVSQEYWSGSESESGSDGCSTCSSGTEPAPTRKSRHIAKNVLIWGIAIALFMRARKTPKPTFAERRKRTIGSFQRYGRA